MKQIKKISVITPCFNAEKYIEETILSVIHQSAIISKRIEFEYIICDGGSADKTLEIIRKYERDCQLIVVSEKDQGMYDALAKGIRKSSGDVCTYINAGDYYSKFAFDVVIDILEKNEVYWLTGINTFYNEKSQIISSSVPFRYCRSFMRAGIYGTILPFVQQESTFWHADLNKKVDLDRLAKFKLAGDFYLWNTFAGEYDLYIVESYLGGFKVHKNQMSENLDKYYSEMRDITSPKIWLQILAWLELPIWHLSGKIKKKLNKQGFFSYNNQLKT